MIDIESFTGDHVYLDANVFIYAVEGFEKYASLCTAVLEAIGERKIQAVTSELTLAEVLVRPLRDKRKDIASVYENLIQSQFGLNVMPVTRDVLLAAAELRASSTCRLPDAIHASTAKLRGCEFFFTADKMLKVPDPIRVVTLDELLEE